MCLGSTISRLLKLLALVWSHLDTAVPVILLLFTTTMQTMRNPPEPDNGHARYARCALVSYCPDLLQMMGEAHAHLVLVSCCPDLARGMGEDPCGPSVNGPNPSSTFRCEAQLLLCGSPLFCCGEPTYLFGWTRHLCWGANLPFWLDAIKCVQKS